MKQKAKSPSWAFILLVVCIILRLLDSRMFHDKPVKRTGPYHLKWAPLAPKPPISKEIGSNNEAEAPPDSVLRRPYFFR